MAAAGDIVERIHHSRSSLIAATAVWLTSIAVAAGAQAIKNPDAAKLKNPTKATAASIDAGRTAYEKYCAFCHNKDGAGHGPMAPKGTNPSNLVDAKWDYGQTDGEIFVNIRDGIGPKFEMKPMKARMTDADIWNVVNYLRSLAAQTKK